MHCLHTLGKVKLTIKLGKEEIRHSVYVVRDDFPMEGILGIDFLAKQKARCDHGKKILSIDKTNLKLQPYQKILLKPRSETIIEAFTNRNQVGIIRQEQPKPEVFIGCCLVDPKEFTRPIGIINTTEKSIEISTSIVNLEEIKTQNTEMLNTVKKDTETIGERRKREQLRTDHLNIKEKETLEQICNDYCDIFHLEDDSLSYTTAVQHEIATRTIAHRSISDRIICPRSIRRR
ncbi:hypothetical protein P5V15_015450 [Pogonomyrmex californicus]